MIKCPEFRIYIGPMFGSKTTRLLGDIDRFSRKGKNVHVFKPKKDKRYSESKISSHNGMTYSAICIENANEIIDSINKSNTMPDIIAVDEAFMIPDIDEVIIDLFKSGITILVSSIQMDANENPFENIKNLLPWSTKIEICSAVCTKCDRDAYYTYPLFDIDNATDEEKIGGSDIYEPRCFVHYFNYNK